MQHGEQIQLSSGEGSGNEGGSGAPSLLYEDFLSSPSLKSALRGQTGDILEARLVGELATGNNILVEAKRDLRTVGPNLLVSLADRATASEKAGSVLLVVPTVADAE